MFKNSSKILFTFTLMAGTMISISSTSWLGSWMGLEINLLSFIPLMNNTKNLMSSESSLKYFLVQALASAVLLFSVIMSSLKYNMMEMLTSVKLMELLMVSSLLMKSGAAPFHFWFPGVMEGLSWINSLILMTWQKIAPLMLISYLFIKTLFIFPIILSALVGSMGGLNQTSLRKLMAFSSINHIGWMLAAMMSEENLWLLYFVMYTFLSSTLVLMFNNYKLFHFNQLFTMFTPSKSFKFSIFMNMLSLGGLPPFLGFFPKWMVIQLLTNNNQILLMFIMTMFTLITLFFYLRMTFAAFMLNYNEPSWVISLNTNNLNSFIYYISSFFSISGLVLVSMVYLML
uniref:NADH-ubiquinone oxidoreductase chain 2 n=1 Tax=Hemipenthes neimengguensis TaxID=2783692 RepID=A0A7S6VJ69_9MUSC|nr:NADH dehydrogenase subunit 2 [Hemipenthes neimengguensis]QOW39611.1 NADH dehydrogenase subunit 2 [Hemipenthes neimengguensis]